MKVLFIKSMQKSKSGITLLAQERIVVPIWKQGNALLSSMRKEEKSRKL